MNQLLETACLEICSHCREANRWADSKKKGHALAQRPDTAEWQHSFIDGTEVTIAYCLASKLRNTRGR